VLTYVANMLLAYVLRATDERKTGVQPVACTPQHVSTIVYSHLQEVKKVKFFPLQAQCGPRLGRGIALLFHDRGTRRG